MCLLFNSVNMEPAYIAAKDTFIQRCRALLPPPSVFDGEDDGVSFQWHDARGLVILRLYPADEEEPLHAIVLHDVTHNEYVEKECNTAELLGLFSSFVVPWLAQRKIFAQPVMSL
jgi:hypothetical protein